MKIEDCCELEFITIAVSPFISERQSPGQVNIRRFKIFRDLFQDFSVTLICVVESRCVKDDSFATIELELISRNLASA